MIRNKLSLPLLALMTLLLGACVTINIYFPEAAAEEAARTIVRDVLGKGQGEAEAKPGPQSQVEASWPVRLADRMLNALIPAAHAAQANIDISSPAISRLRSAMAARQRQLASVYRSGAVGFADNGLVKVRDPAQIPLRDRTRVKKLVADENRDRNALYREIARANGHPEWEPEVRATFARVWVDEAPAGTWYQTGGGWQQR